jgi:hypothetical protein
MKIRKMSSNKIWEYENAFYWFSHNERLIKILNHYELIKKFSNIKGDIFEFGIFKGTSLIRNLSFINHLKLNKKLIAFDAFGHFPKSKLSKKSDQKFSRTHDAGTPGLSKKTINKILINKNFSNFKLIKGNVLNTLSPFLKNYNSKISMLFMDLDVYDPTKYVINKLYNRINKGGVIICDNFNIVPGETLAVKEFAKLKNIKIRYFDKNLRVAIIIK